MFTKFTQLQGREDLIPVCCLCISSFFAAQSGFTDDSGKSTYHGLHILLTYSYNASPFRERVKKKNAFKLFFLSLFLFIFFSLM